MSTKKSFDLLQQLLTFISPEKLDALAKETGFIKRKRQITASEFLSLLFGIHGNLLNCSLQELCAKLSMNQNISVSRTAIDKKFTLEAVEFLHRLIQELFLAQNQISFSKLSLAETLPLSSIRVIDATHVGVPDYLKKRAQKTQQDSAKIQFEFDLLSGHFTYLNVDFKRINDTRMGNERIPFIMEEELCMQDLGYFSIKQLKKIDEHNAYFISKIRNDAYVSLKNPFPSYYKNGNVVKNSEYQRIDLVELCRNLKPGEILELEGIYFGLDAHFPSRCIIFSQGEEEKKARIKKINRRATKSGKKPKQVIRDLANITIYISNLPNSVSAEQIVQLYRLRWQIELQFKVWKSYLEIDHFKLVKKERWICHLYATLLVYLISQFIAYQLRNILWEEKQIEISEMVAVRTISKEVLPKLHEARKKKKGCIEFFQAAIELLRKTARKAKSVKRTAIHRLLFS